jgi:hypothetical protein
MAKCDLCFVSFSYFVGKMTRRPESRRQNEPASEKTVVLLFSHALPENGLSVFIQPRLEKTLVLLFSHALPEKWALSILSTHGQRTLFSLYSYYLIIPGQRKLWSYYLVMRCLKKGLSVFCQPTARENCSHYVVLRCLKR